MRRKLFILTFLYLICGMATVFYLGGQKSHQFYQAKKYHIFEYHRPYHPNIQKSFEIIPARYHGLRDGFYLYISDTLFKNSFSAQPSRATFKFPKTATDKGDIRDTGAILDVTLIDPKKTSEKTNQIMVVMSGYLFTHDTSDQDKKDIAKVTNAIDQHLTQYKITQKIIPILTDSPYDLHAYLPAQKKIIQGPQLMPLAPDHGLMRGDALAQISRQTNQNTINDILTWPLAVGPAAIYRALCLIDGC